MICDAIHLLKVNKIPLVEKDIKTWGFKWSYNWNLSSGSGKVNLATFYGNCEQTDEFAEKFLTIYL